MITNFNQLIESLRLRGERRTVAVVWASDPTTKGQSSAPSPMA